MRSTIEPQGRRWGFTLPELIIGILLATFFALITVRTVIAAQQLLPGRAASVEGAVLPIAPSLSAFTDAVHLHSVFTQWVRSARAIYVFGGSHQGIAPTASRCSVAPLETTELPAIDTFSAGLPLDTYAFRATYTSQLGPAEVSGNAGDFTVVTVGSVEGILKVTSLAQVRSSEVSIHDGASAGKFVLRTVRLYDISGETLNYAFLEKASIAEQAAVGARHFWYRYAEGRVAEEGPVTVTFPDPWCWTHATSAATMPALSRFVYCLPVSA